MTEFSFCEVSL